MLQKDEFRKRVLPQVEITSVETQHIAVVDAEGTTEEVDVVELRGWFKVTPAVPAAFFALVAILGPVIH